MSNKSLETIARKSRKAFGKEPNLLVKNKKPINHVTIDRESPMSHGLIGAWLFNGDLTKDTAGNYDGTIVGAVSRGFDENGSFCRVTSDGTGDNLSLGIIDSGLNGFNGNCLSFYFYTKLGSSVEHGNAFPRVIFRGSDTVFSGGGYEISIRPDQNFIRYIHRGGSYTSTFDFASGKVSNSGDLAGIGVTAQGGNLVFGYFNGEYDSQSGGNIDDYNDNLKQTQFFNWVDLDRQYRTPIYCIYIWNRPLSTAEHFEIHNNRYGFFESI